MQENPFNYEHVHLQVIVAAVLSSEFDTICFFYILLIYYVHCVCSCIILLFLYSIIHACHAAAAAAAATVPQSGINKVYLSIYSLSLWGRSSDQVQVQLHVSINWGQINLNTERPGLSISFSPLMTQDSSGSDGQTVGQGSSPFSHMIWTPQRTNTKHWPNVYPMNAIMIL